MAFVSFSQTIHMPDDQPVPFCAYFDFILYFFLYIFNCTDQKRKLAKNKLVSLLPYTLFPAGLIYFPLSTIALHHLILQVGELVATNPEYLGSELFDLHLTAAGSVSQAREVESTQMSNSNEGAQSIYCPLGFQSNVITSAMLITIFSFIGWPRSMYTSDHNFI